MTNTSSRLSGALGILLGLNDKSVQELTPDQREKVVRWLYDILGIIEAKSAYVLTTSTISLAAQTFLVGLILGESFKLDQVSFAGVLKALLLASLLIPLLASIVALQVFQIRWPFLEQVRSRGLQTEIEELARECDRRDRQHRWAWRLSMVAAITLGIIIVVTAIRLVCM